MQDRRLILIADDFTGSNDTGVQFSKNGLKTVVMTNLDLLDEALSNCDVLVVDTESRFDDSKTAYDKTLRVGHLIKRNKVNYFYKKLDSTFRGNIGSEIAGAMDGIGVDFAIVAPAFPAAGRKTLGGRVYVHDTLLEKTEVAVDPKNPVMESFIPAIIAQQSDKRTAIIDRSIVLYGIEALHKAIIDQRNRGVEIIVIDSVDAEDLNTVAQAIAQMKDRFLMVGSAGLAEFLPKTLKLMKEKKSIGVIVGSVSDITRKQANYAIDKYGLEEVIIHIQDMFTSKEEEKKRILGKVIKLVEENKDFVLRSTKTAEDVNQAIDIGKEYGLDSYGVSDKIAQFIGEITKGILDSSCVAGLMLTGGDIAIKAATMLGVSGTMIKNEILPGIPYGYFLHDTYGNLPIVTKAGGFGEEDAIIKVIDYLRREC
ncbi:four-carbon acid sugar kinase family protein [Alkaliphilus hydrothermalis]|uniref:Uncharacterized protein YgbK (DUF1537 family) n=1 Tax=Alkaliphilus hydrothermalis TaxID=1482730 RepID=A0ABS2NRX3_9FIRM|nr:four-carbon acid sugar kinase family protein [Alkaliphilus hydrothermalis]MBM7615627.1 uncharacterized protein YgbK (DUF1537 family) [Alkaliphilus hydrothermalis]